MRSVLGLDVGGSSIKAGLVDVDTGCALTPLRTVPTPQPSSPQATIEAIGEIDRALHSVGAPSGPVGLAFPSVVQRGIARTAANVDASWLGVDGGALLGATLGRHVVFLNDADAAGIAEMKWGSGRNCSGVVIMLTFGTGIGSAIFTDGVLLPNTELGHLELRGRGDAELWASARVKSEENLGWQDWADRVNEYLARMHALFWPDVFILGGAVSASFDTFGPLLSSPAQIRAAHFAGQAGVIGAALAAASRYPP